MWYLYSDDMLLVYVYSKMFYINMWYLSRDDMLLVYVLVSYMTPD